jgi:hypothetical protein
MGERELEKLKMEILGRLKERNITDIERLAEFSIKQVKTDERGNPRVSAVLAGSWYVLVS